MGERRVVPGKASFVHDVVAYAMLAGFQPDFSMMLAVTAEEALPEDDPASSSLPSPSDPPLAYAPTLREELYETLWCIDRSTLDDVLHTVLAEEAADTPNPEDEQVDVDVPLPLPSPYGEAGEGADASVFLATLSRRLSDVLLDDWETCVSMLSNGEERCLAQQDALRSYDLHRCLFMERELREQQVWETTTLLDLQAEHAREEREALESGAQEEADAALAASIAAAEDAPTAAPPPVSKVRPPAPRPPAPQLLPRHNLGFRLTAAAPKGFAAAAARPPRFDALPDGRPASSPSAPSSLSGAALELLDTLHCVCGVGVSRASILSGTVHSRPCLEQLYRQAHSADDELRQMKVAKARAGVELARKWGRSAPGAGMAYRDEVKRLAARQDSARAAADVVLFYLHNPRAAAEPFRSAGDGRGQQGSVAAGSSSSAVPGGGRINDLEHALTRGELLGPRGGAGARGPGGSAGAGDSLDMHGLTAAGALELLATTLSTAVGQGQYKVRFITGVGKHSSGGRSVVKVAVGARLREMRSEGELVEGGGRVCCVTDVRAIEGNAGFDVFLTALQ